QQIYCRAHLVLDKVSRLFSRVRLRKHLLIAGTDAQSRTAIISKVDYVFAVLFELLDINLRRDQNWLFGRVAASRKRIESANELQLSGQSFQINSALFREMRQFVRLKLFEAISDQLIGQSVGFAAR